MSTIPRAYLDTCVISGLARRDLPPTEQGAADSLIELVYQSRVTVCTSTEAWGEIQQVPEQHRQPHLRQYQQISILTKAAEWFDTDEVYTPEAQQVLARLRSVVPGEIDARHIAHAAMHGVPDFITTDRKTILRHASEIHGICGVLAVSPAAYVARIEQQL